jgi:hypothetical protein
MADGESDHGETSAGPRRLPLPSMSIEELLTLPVAVDLETAGRAFGFGRTKSHELARANEFPCPVKRFGNRYRVLRADLLAAMSLDPVLPARPPAVAGGGTPEPATGQRDGFSGEAARVLYDALMAAARVLVDRGAKP